MLKEDPKPLPNQPVAPSVEVRRLLRCARKAALATLDHSLHCPYASLVSMATEPDGAPVLVLSRLALHTRNLAADPRASLLVEAGGTRSDPLAGGRVSLVGQVRPAASQTAERRFLAVHPSAAGYAGFADFGFFILDIEWAHYVGGFGRISTLAPPDVLVDIGEASELVAAEPDLLATFNREEAGRLAKLGVGLSGGREGAWRLTGIDPAGCDLALGDERYRCEFAEVATSRDAVRQAMAMLLGQG